MRRWIWTMAALAGCAGSDPLDEQQPSGEGETVFAPSEDPQTPFFLELGTNQRSCASCHDRAAGWSVTPTRLQALFDASDGTDPIFRPIDGATAPSADVSTTEARRTAYALLLDKGLIRVGATIPADAELTLTAVEDPYGHASAAELSLFRRPLPSTNLRFLASIMWDAREPSLDRQALDATLGHAEATIGPADALARIVAFESSSYTAQRFDEVAGDLSSDGARGGATTLVTQTFAIGINDRDGSTFDREVFTLYSSWEDADTSTDQGERRAAIARGERIFNTERFRIRGVGGLADQQGTCSTCHDTPNIGSHSVAALFDIGVSDDDGGGGRGRGNGDDLAALPHYTFTNNRDGRVVRTTDPGLALTTGRWDDLGKFKVPSLRGLAMRPPYFHNGRAQNLGDVVRFYRRRFDLDLSDREQGDLVAFLSAL